MGRRAAVLTGKNVLVAVLALVLRSLAFQALVQVFYLLLLQTLKCERIEPPPQGTSTGGEVTGQSHVRGTERRQGGLTYPSPTVPGTHLKLFPEAGLGCVFCLLLLVQFQDPVLDVRSIYPSGIVRLGGGGGGEEVSG